MMRRALILTAASFSIVYGLLACSGTSPSTPIEDVDASRGTDDASDRDAGTSSDLDASADAASASDAGQDGGGSVEDAGACIDESEDNDVDAGDAGDAGPNPLPGIPSVFCGHVDADDVDYATFTLNTSSFKTNWTYSSSPITLTATVEGQSFDLAGSAYVIKPGKTYVIKVTAAAATDYRIQFLPN